MENTASTHKTQIELDSVQAFLNGYYKNPISRLTFISGGEGSQAFSYEHNREEFVIRFNRHDDTSFKKDRYAFTHFKSQLIPIPEIVEIGPIDGYHFAISKKVQGKLLKALSEGEFNKALSDLLAVLEAIHQTPVSETEGYGKWNGNGIGEKASWKEVLLNVDQYAKTMFGSTFLEKDVWGKVYARFIELVSYCPEDRYLAHGDYSIDNVLIENNKVSGVIDWGGSLYGDFLFDIAWLSFWSREFDYEKAYLEFAKTIQKNIENFNERILCYKLYIGLGGLSFYAYSNQKDKYDRSKEKLLELIQI